MNQLDEGIIRYSLFSKWRQNKNEAMKQYFGDEETGQFRFSTKWMTAGSAIAAALEERPLPWWLADITPADISEYRIIEDLDGVKMRGTLDKFFYDGTIVDNKSLKRKMTAKEESMLLQKHRFNIDDFTSLKNNFVEKDVISYKEQLCFYQVLVQQRHGNLNETSYIEIIPVFEDLNGLIRRTGEKPVVIPIIISQSERDAMRAEMIRVGNEIMMVYAAYKRGEVRF